MGWYKNVRAQSLNQPMQPEGVQPEVPQPQSNSATEPADKPIESAADEEQLAKAYGRYHDILKYSPDHDKVHAMTRAAELFGLKYEQLAGYADNQSTVV
jgi:hypothetical protein